MPHRLYYTDSMLCAFDAEVLSCEVIDGRTVAVLDRTAFYPTSGGQPFDTGRLSGVDVLEVIEDDEGEVRHVVGGVLEAGTTVTGAIDWPRRFDHMQQHTGQHVLSAAFDRRHGVGTVSFHLGADVSTIDLAREVTAAEIAAAEADANAVVWEDRPVTVRFVSADDATRLPLRKAPARAGELRLVDVADFDLSACGGTHVTRTGAIGIIAVSGWERVKGATRVSFVCGGRALASHRALRDVVVGATRALSVVPAAVPEAIQRLQQDVKAAKKVTDELRQARAMRHGAALRESAEVIGAARVVLAMEPESDAALLKVTAASVVTEPGFVAVLAGAGAPTPVVVARSNDVSVDAARLVRQLIERFGGRGGGRPDLAQGGVGAPPDAVAAEIRRLLS
jgi:alanyl-tRNA synthetase